jgi:transcriptional regulator with XRE-family HTH domain
VKNPAKVKEFGVHLRRLRQAKGLSQQQLADLADVSKITVQRIENAKFNVTLDTLISLSTALETPLSKVFHF